MELTGLVIAVLPARSGVSARTGNAWMTKDFVIEVPGEYPKKCTFTIYGEDRIKQLNVKQNETVTVHFNIDAHEYQGRWFNEIRCYNITNPSQITVPAASAAPQQSTTVPAASPAAQQPPAQSEEKGDDLPF